MSKPSSGAPLPPNAGRRAQFWRLIGRYDRLPIDPDLAPDDPSEPAVGHRLTKVAVHRRDPAILVSIGAGGFLGAVGRYEMGLAFPVAAGAFPFTTFAINTSGAFALGVVLTFILERLPPNRYLRPFMCVGVLGAWTTMSTLATESAVLMKDGHLPIALIYLAATVVCGVGATAIGIALIRRRELVS